MEGSNDSVSYAGYEFSNVSAAGTVMPVDVTRVDEPRKLAALKWRWFKRDPDRDGYQLFGYERATTQEPTVIDFSEVPRGDDPNRSHSMVLEGYYSTGEQRSLNYVAQWSSSTPYVTVSTSPAIGGPGTTELNSIVGVRFQQSEVCPEDRSALLTADIDGDRYVAELVNIPCH